MTEMKLGQTTARLGQMCWLPTFGGDSQEKILHLRSNASEAWRPYSTSMFGIADYKIQGGSKGWATYQKLSKAGWELVKSEGQA